jgi:hypothetical protein
LAFDRPQKLLAKVLGRQVKESAMCEISNLQNHTALSALGSNNLQTGGTGEQHRHLSLSWAQRPTASAVAWLEVGCKKYFVADTGVVFS